MDGDPVIYESTYIFFVDWPRFWMVAAGLALILAILRRRRAGFKPENRGDE